MRCSVVLGPHGNDTVQCRRRGTGYWIVDLDEPVSLLACHLAEGFGYQDGGSVTGVFTTPEPFPVRLQLGQLL